MKYLAWNDFGDIVKWLPADERAEATWQFLVTGHCHIERISKPHTVPKYRLIRPRMLGYRMEHNGEEV